VYTLHILRTVTQSALGLPRTESVNYESRLKLNLRMDDHSCEFSWTAAPRSGSVTTSMHFATRSLPPLTRCKLAQYTSKRCFHAFQSAPRLKPQLWVATPLRVSRPNASPFACRRMFHATPGESPSAPRVTLHQPPMITPEPAVRHGHVTRPKPGTG